MIKKNIILASLCLATYLSSSKLVAKASNKTLCLLHRSYFCSCVCVYVCVCLCVCVCVCVHACARAHMVSQFDLSILKQNYLFVRCQSLSHIPNTSLQCSNQPLWKLNLINGVNITKNQMGKIKNTI